jgi:hypothetical protein
MNISSTVRKNAAPRFDNSPKSSSAPTGAIVDGLAKTVTRGAQGDGSPKDTSDIDLKTVVTRGAITVGGGMGGAGLGAITGQVMMNLSGSPVFSTFGGVAGAIGGAAAGFAASQGDVSKETLVRSGGAWLGASVGSAAGMWVVGAAGAALAASGASSLFAVNGALIGTAAGGLVGAAIPFVGTDGKATTLLKEAAVAGTGGTIGLLAGGLAQTAVPEQLAHMAVPAPLLGAVALGLTGLHVMHNGIDRYEIPKMNLKRAKDSAWAGTFGYAIGGGVGALAQSLGGSAAYTYAGPALGAVVATLAIAGDGRDNKLTHSAAVLGLTGVGATAGDVIGHGLTALTGHPIYQNVGVAAGAINGAVAGLSSVGVDTKHGLPLVTGLASGTASGALVGAGISALTGQEIWKVAMPIVGSAFGVLTGLALSLNSDKKASGNATPV